MTPILRLFRILLPGIIVGIALNAAFQTSAYSQAPEGSPTRAYKPRPPEGKVPILWIGGGDWHDTLNNAGILRWYLEAAGPYHITYTEDYDVFTRLRPYRVVVMHHQARSITNAEERALLDAVSAGKPVVALHSSTAALRVEGHERPKYHALLGARFLKHPPQHDFRVTLTDRAHPILSGLDDFNIWDELYMFDSLQPDRHVLMTADFEGTTYPIAWTRQHGKGKVFYTALGHGVEANSNPHFQRLVHQAIEWALE